jgi:zinc transport system ATP-binding protein
VTDLLQVEGITLAYGRRVVVADLSFHLERGGYLGLVGPNGCGKTTVLRALLGAIRPVRGAIRWKSGSGRPVRLGYVPQRDAIDPIFPFDALEVVLLARSARHVVRSSPTPEDLAGALTAMRMVGLAEQARVPYRELSGGQRQRVLVARALAVEPDVLLLDEPVSGMDPAAAATILDLVSRLHRKDGITVVLVSHDLSLVAQRAETAVAMSETSALAGAVDAVFAESVLEELYGCPFHVSTSGGRRVVSAEAPPALDRGPER